MTIISPHCQFVAPDVPQQQDDATGNVATDAPESLTTLKEIGGPSGPEPTRYGDWERRGRCIDF